MHARQRSIFHLAACVALLASAGCSHDPMVPASAKLVDVGQGRLHYIAEENGSVHLFDSMDKKDIFNTHVDRGEAITVDPGTNKIDIAGNAADHKPPLSPEHSYRLYFDRDS